MQALVLIDLFERDHRAVNARHHGGAVIVFALEVAARQPEEVEHQQEENGHEHNQSPSHRLVVKKPIGQCTTGRNDQEQHQQDVLALVMDFDFHLLRFISFNLQR